MDINLCCLTATYTCTHVLPWCIKHETFSWTSTSAVWQLLTHVHYFKLVPYVLFMRVLVSCLSKLQKSIAVTKYKFTVREWRSKFDPSSFTSSDVHVLPTCFYKMQTEKLKLHFRDFHCLVTWFQWTVH